MGRTATHHARPLLRFDLPEDLREDGSDRGVGRAESRPEQRQGPDDGEGDEQEDERVFDEALTRDGVVGARRRFGETSPDGGHGVGTATSRHPWEPRDGGQWARANIGEDPGREISARRETSGSSEVSSLVAVAGDPCAAGLLSWAIRRRRPGQPRCVVRGQDADRYEWIELGGTGTH